MEDCWVAVKRREFCIRLLRDGFGVWPGEGFCQQESLSGYWLPTECESGLLPDTGLNPGDQATTTSLLPHVRRVAVFNAERMRGNHLHYDWKTWL